VPADVDALARVPFLSGLGERQLRKLARLAKARSFKQGTDVVKEGTMSGVGFFVISSGEATVRKGGRKRGTLRPGDHFGELALIGDRTRTATVRAETPLECLELTSWHFRQFVQGNPDVAWKLLQHVVGMLSRE
jgi:voltage-gated potassium channel